MRSKWSEVIAYKMGRLITHWFCSRTVGQWYQEFCKQDYRLSHYREQLHMKLATHIPTRTFYSDGSSVVNNDPDVSVWVSATDHRTKEIQDLYGIQELKHRVIMPYQ